MKRKSFFVIFSLILTLSVCAKIVAIANNQDVIPIIISPGNSGSEGGPRSSEYNPFTAFRGGDTVIVNCSDDIGIVDVFLFSSSGDSSSVAFDTEEGNVLIPISGEPGYYLLRIIVSSDIHYVGRFEI